MSSTNPGPATTTQVPVIAAVGNVANQFVLTATLSPAQVAANTSAEQSFTVTGLAVDDVVQVNKATAQAGLVIGQVRAAANTLYITFGNLTTAAITPTATEVYLISVTRPMAQGITNGLPTALPLA